MSLPPAPAHARRLVFLGTPEASVGTLRGLVETGHEVALVVSQPDRRRGRGARTSPSPVKQAAIDLGLPVSDVVGDALEVDADLGVVVAFGRLIKPHVLAELPMVNIHFSLLPRWRGAAPVERAILAGDERTGVDLMVVEEGLDTGGIYDRAETVIGPDETAEVLRQRLARMGTELLLANLARGLGEPRPQQGEPTYAHKLEQADLAIDWSGPAVAVHRVVRVGGAWTTHGGHRLKVWRTSLSPAGRGAIEVPVGDGSIWLAEVQPEGRRRMEAAAWANGIAGDVTAGLGR
ncbi:MAG TPA: methionyl-tRNA formyltransferase [Acidimicrobiales bacterium]|nr:methionyl-tRNA formyltransferase [Acidimicrobiales bacterium]